MMGLRPLHHPGRAIGAGILNGLFLLALPWGVTYFVLGILRSGGSSLLGGTGLWTASEVAPLITWLENLQRLILFVGGVATALAALAAFFAKGTILRLIFGLGRQGARFAWLFIILTGGLWTLQFTLGGNPFSGFGGGGSGSTAVQLTLDLTGIFTLVYAALATTALYFIAEFVVWWRNLRRARQYADGAPASMPPPPPGY